MHNYIYVTTIYLCLQVPKQPPVHSQLQLQNLALVSCEVTCLNNN